MKKFNVFIFLCCFLLCCFSVEIYAQGNTQQYSDDEFEFEFEVELIYADDDGDDDDDEDDDDENEDDELIGVQINVENSGESVIDADILFRAHISYEEPETVPSTYDAEEILYLLDLPLQPNESGEVFIDLLERGGGKVVTIWPLIDTNAHKSTIQEGDIPFVSVTIPKTEISNKLAISNFTPIKTYPNPTTGILNMDIPENISINQIIIYNKTGQVTKTFDVNRNGSFQLNLQNLPKGMYFVAIRNEQGQTLFCSWQWQV